MNLVLWILFGALVGWIASLAVGGLSSRQAEMMTVLAVIGGIIGGWITNILCDTALNDFNIYSVIVAVITAGIAVWLYKNRLIPPQ